MLDQEGQQLGVVAQERLGGLTRAVPLGRAETANRNLDVGVGGAERFRNRAGFGLDPDRHG